MNTKSVKVMWLVMLAWYLLSACAAAPVQIANGSTLPLETVARVCTDAMAGVPCTYVFESAVRDAWIIAERNGSSYNVILVQKIAQDKQASDYKIAADNFRNLVNCLARDKWTQLIKATPEVTAVLNWLKNFAAVGRSPSFITITEGMFKDLFYRYSPGMETIQ